MTTETTPAPRITRIEVTGLFGLYDHVINLNLEDRVTILHGPNGVGKTVLLKMIRAVLNKQFDELAQIPFQRFRIDLTSGQAIDITSKITEKPAPPGETLKRLTAVGSKLEAVYTRATKYPEPKIFDNAGLPGGLSQQFPEVCWNPIPVNSLRTSSIKRPPVHLIEDQRILRRLEKSPQLIKPTSQLHPAVWGNAIDLRSRIDALRRTYGDTSRELDQSFPTRLVQKNSESRSSIDLKSRMTGLEDLRARLRHNGLIDEPQAEPFDVTSLDGLSPAQSDVMALVVGDSEKKLGIFTDLLQRVELFLRIVNNRFSGKTLRADYTQGLVAADHQGHSLALQALSSGEQQQIVLFYDLLFRAERNTLVLLDEPELSWHILWQERFLADVLEIVKLVGIDVLIATHSPEIIGDRTDLTVALSSKVAHAEPSNP